MPNFRVVKQEAVVSYRDRVLMETDDWLEAEAAVIKYGRDTSGTMYRDFPHIIGTHPTHDFDAQTNRCRNEGCRSWNNGSYGSHAPCGTVFTGSLMAMIDDAAKVGA